MNQSFNATGYLQFRDSEPLDLQNHEVWGSKLSYGGKTVTLARGVKDPKGPPGNPDIFAVCREPNCTETDREEIIIDRIGTSVRKAYENNDPLQVATSSLGYPWMEPFGAIIKFECGGETLFDLVTFEVEIVDIDLDRLDEEFNTIYGVGEFGHTIIYRYPGHETTPNQR